MFSKYILLLKDVRIEKMSSAINFIFRINLYLPIVYIDDSARELVDSLNQKIEKHRDGADSNDDLTMLCLFIQ